MEPRLGIYLNQLSKLLVYLIVFLLPLYFLPIVPSNLELHKNFLFYALILLALLLFLGKAVIEKNVVLRRTPLDVFILVLWGVYFLASILSQDRYISFFGDFSFLKQSFVGFSLMVVFYFLVIQHFRDIKQGMSLIYLLISSGTIASVYFVLQAVKLIDWSSWSFPVTSPIHSSSLLFGSLVGLLFVLSLAFLGVKNKRVTLDYFLALTMILNGAAVVMLGFKLVWVIVVVATFLVLVFFLSYLDLLKKVWSSVAFLMLVISLLFVVLGIPKFLTTNVPAEISLSQGTSFTIAVESLTSGIKNFVFGSGPGTFVHNFSTFRPQIMNSNFAWNVRFNEPSSSIMEWLATNGLVATLAFLGVLLMVLGTIIATWLKQVSASDKQKKGTDQTVLANSSPLFFWGLSAGWLALLLALFLINFGAVHWMVFWLLTALVVSFATVGGGHKDVVMSLKTIPQYALITSFSFILVFTSIVVLAMYLGRFYVAEVTYARSLVGPVEERISGMQKAASLNSSRALFQLSLSESYLAQAQTIADNGGDVNQIYQLLALAVGAAKQATELAPHNVASWEYLSNMYANARAVAPDANTWVLNSLDRAIELEPTNPLLYLSRGNARAVGGAAEDAVTDLERAVSLKPDLINGYMNLGLIHEQNQNLDAAIAALEKGISYGRNNPVYLMQMGRYYYNRNGANDYANAEIVLRQAISLSPNYSDALFALALLYEVTSNTAVALPLYERVLELNPNNEVIKTKVSQLRPRPSLPDNEDEDEDE